MTTTSDLEQTTYKRFGILLIIIGALFGLNYFLDLPFVLKLWPILTLMMGTGLIGIFSKRMGRGVPYLMLGLYLTQFSILALFLNFTSWDHLQFLWPLFIAFMGVVFAALYAIRKKGKLVLFLSLTMFVLTGFFFLMKTAGSQYWWTIFFLLGLSVLFTGKKR